MQVTLSIQLHISVTGYRMKRLNFANDSIEQPSNQYFSYDKRIQD